MNDEIEFVPDQPESIELTDHRRDRQSNDDEPFQIKVRCRVKPTRAGTEILSFVIPLGPLRLVCVANIPEEDQETAPVYVKFLLGGRDRD